MEQGKRSHTSLMVFGAPRERLFHSGHWEKEQASVHLHSKTHQLCIAPKAPRLHLLLLLLCTRNLEVAPARPGELLVLGGPLPRAPDADAAAAAAAACAAVGCAGRHPTPRRRRRQARRSRSGAAGTAAG